MRAGVVLGIFSAFLLNGCGKDVFKPPPFAGSWAHASFQDTNYIDDLLVFNNDGTFLIKERYTLWAQTPTGQYVPGTNWTETDVAGTYKYNSSSVTLAIASIKALEGSGNQVVSSEDQNATAKDHETQSSPFSGPPANQASDDDKTIPVAWTLVNANTLNITAQTSGTILDGWNELDRLSPKQAWPISSTNPPPVPQ